jgi:type VI secretion system protein ImpI
MTLVLTIENADALPEGFPCSIAMPDHGCLDIGRKPGLGWTLPDAQRFISSKHCEIHDRAGTYWLYDISTNGTFMNGEKTRIKAARQLSHGDRVAIGIYIIKVTIDAENAGAGLSSLGSTDEASCTGHAFQYDAA